MTDTALHTKRLAELRQLLDAKQVSSQELTQHFLDRIDRLDSQFNSVITPMHEQAIHAAKQADERIANGDINALTGIPLLHKDIFCTKSVRTSCGSKMLDNFIAPYNATVVQKLQDAGMVCLGKTNMDEFAMGSSNETSFYGNVQNPWNTGYVPGGSSGGSAAAMAARLAPIATGTDTGGSIRQPSAHCGLTGLKPTYGRVSRYGMIAFASSLDQAGPMATSAEDAAILLSAMSGFDANDSTSINQPAEDYSQQLNDSLAGLRIGLPKQYFGEGLHAEIANAIEQVKTELEKLGATFHEIDLPHSDLSVAAYYVIAPAEASSNLSRYDGVRYGYRCDNPADLQDMYTRSRSEAFGDEVKRRILIGTYALSTGFYDAYYRKAQQIRRLIQQDFVEAFKQVDVILGPTTPNPAFKFGEKGADPVAMYLEDIYTISANLAGLPAMSAPAGFVNDLPVGFQLIGNYYQEAKLLNITHQYQQHTDWHTRTPAAID